MSPSHLSSPTSSLGAPESKVHGSCTDYILLTAVLPSPGLPSPWQSRFSPPISPCVCLAASLPVPIPTPEGVAQVTLALSLMQQTPLGCWLCQGKHWDEPHLACSILSGKAIAQDAQPQSTALSYVAPLPPPGCPGTVLHRPIHGQASVFQRMPPAGFLGQGIQQGKVETTRDHIRGKIVESEMKTSLQRKASLVTHVPENMPYRAGSELCQKARKPKPPPSHFGTSWVSRWVMCLGHQCPAAMT